jgi:hypothetical protein
MSCDRWFTGADMVKECREQVDEATDDEECDEVWTEFVELGKKASDKIAKATGSCAICSAVSFGIGLKKPHQDFFLANSKMTSSSVQWYKDKKGRNKYWVNRQAFELFHAATVRKTE